VFDHTSVLQFLEKFLSHKVGRPVEEPNISPWRRTVCGDLTSAFQAQHVGEDGLPPAAERLAVIEGIHRAKFKGAPAGYRMLTSDEVDQLRRDAQASPLMPRQEPGVRRSCPLPYELHVDGTLNPERNRVVVGFEVGNQRFGARAAGSPFVVYARTRRDDVVVRDYAVAAGSRLEDSWALGDFENGIYHLCVYGPNGFYREFRGTAGDTRIETRIQPARLKENDALPSGNVEVLVVNRDNHPCEIEVDTLAYSKATHRQRIGPGESSRHVIDAQASFGWYDIGIRFGDSNSMERRLAGRIETGQWSFSDPLIGRPKT
jgi:phospholipase C